MATRWLQASTLLQRSAEARAVAFGPTVEGRVRASLVCVCSAAGVAGGRRRRSDCGVRDVLEQAVGVGLAVGRSA